MGRPRRDRRRDRAAASSRASGSRCCCATARAQVGLLARAPARRARAWSPRTPTAAPNGCAPTSRRSASDRSPASPTTSTRSRRDGALVRERRSSAPLDVTATRVATPTPATAAPRRRGRDAHERHDRPAEAGAAHLRDVARACSIGAKHYERNADADVRLRSRRHHRQLADGAPRRPVPRAAVRERRPVVLPARTVPRRRVGRRGAPPPARAP